MLRTTPPRKNRRRRSALPIASATGTSKFVVNGVNETMRTRTRAFYRRFSDKRRSLVTQTNTVPKILPTINRFALPVGFLVGLGLAVVPSGGCGGVPLVADMPVGLAEPIRGCAVKHERHIEGSDHTVKFDVALVNGQVDSLVLVESTLGDEELETCIATKIRSFTVDELPLHHSANLERDLAPPESRELLGNPAVPVAACLASPPCLLALVVVMGTAVITVQLVVYSATTTAPITATPTTTATPVPTTTATPTATATTTTTSPPIAVPRRYPKQTCENAELDRLGDEMEKLCKKGFAAKCLSENALDKKLEKGRTVDIPCSVVLHSIVQRQACLAARWAVQNKCFDGKPDDRHWPPINQTQDGINNCEALKLIVCAKGHPMAGK